jgi:hypothetical protein
MMAGTPCNTSWKNMDGDERIRLCATCSQNVYDLRAFEEDEAQGFLSAQEDEEGTQLFRRSDGTILLSDCPVGMRRRHRRRVLGAALIVTAMIALVAVAVSKIKFSTPSKTATAARIVEPPRKKANAPIGDADEDPTTQAQRAALRRAAEADDALGTAWGIGSDTGTTVNMPVTDPSYANEFALVPNRTWTTKGTPTRSGKYHGAVVQNTYISIARIDALSIRSIATVVDGRFPRFKNCYQVLLDEASWLVRLGGLRIAFTIAADGSVRDVGFDGAPSTADKPSSLIDPTFTECIKSEFNTLTFSPPSDGKPVRIGYGFLFYED